MINRRGLFALLLAVGFLVSVHFMGGIACLIAPNESEDLIAAAQEEVSNNLRRLYEERNEKPNQLRPLNIDLDNIDSQIIKLGPGGTGGHGGVGRGGAPSGGGGRGGG